jgi:hypothetical protein
MCAQAGSSEEKGKGNCDHKICCHHKRNVDIDKAADAVKLSQRLDTRAGSYVQLMRLSLRSLHTFG